jgi:8-oxo-dGTP pyrophosphatase MutT (NUDIX family)
MDGILRQAGVIPFRVGPHGLEVLLVTSRNTGRWVIPRGNIERGQTARQAAKREAYEEAGVRGTVRAVPLGVYTYDKLARPGLPLPAEVEVFALLVEKQAKKWPERAQRRSQWFDTISAADLVHEHGLALLILGLNEVETEALPTSVM